MGRSIAAECCQQTERGDTAGAGPADEPGEAAPLCQPTERGDPAQTGCAGQPPIARVQLDALHRELVSIRKLNRIHAAIPAPAPPTRKLPPKQFIDQIVERRDETESDWRAGILDIDLRRLNEALAREAPRSQPPPPFRQLSVSTRRETEWERLMTIFQFVQSLRDYGNIRAPGLRLRKSKQYPRWMYCVRPCGASRSVALVSARPGCGCVHPRTCRPPPGQRFSPIDFLLTGAGNRTLLPLPTVVSRAADQ